MKLRAVVLLAGYGCGSKPVEPVEPAGSLAHEPRAAGPVACIAAGTYNVSVDLSNAEITQTNTGMADTDWCRSMLMAVPATQMNAMRIGYEEGALAVRWPPSRKVHADVTSACAFAISDQPIPVTITFAGGGHTAEGRATYSLGTSNHPDERCTATNAKLVLERTGD